MNNPQQPNHDAHAASDSSQPNPSTPIQPEVVSNRPAVSPTNPQPIIHDDEQIGVLMVRTQESKPLFVSPGSGLSFDDAHDLVRSQFEDHRLPEPTFRADQLSRCIANSGSSLGEA